MPIQCITFDLDDTLWECDSVIARAELALYEWLQVQTPKITKRHDQSSLVRHRTEFAKNNPDLGFDITALRKRWLGRIAVEFGYSEAVADDGFQLFWEKRNAVTLFDGVGNLLERLGARYTLGTITNGNADVHYIGIGHLFDFVLSAADAQAAKPDRKIFEDALRLSGHRAADVLHVGDDPVRDVNGARALGMRTAWINPDLSPWPGGQTPDLVLRSVTDLESGLAQFET